VQYYQVTKWQQHTSARRRVDILGEELVATLSRNESFEFKPMFQIVYTNLQARDAASGGEEMLRLRMYEKLQNLVCQGMVKKSGKKYRGVRSMLATLRTETRTETTACQ
jgi:hypothetical protein